MRKRSATVILVLVLCSRVFAAPVQLDEGYEPSPLVDDSESTEEACEKFVQAVWAAHFEHMDALRECMEEMTALDDARGCALDVDDE